MPSRYGGREFCCSLHFNSPLYRFERDGDMSYAYLLHLSSTLEGLYTLKLLFAPLISSSNFSNLL